MTASNNDPVPLLGHRSQTPDVTAPDGSVRHRSVEEVWYVLEGAGMVWRCPPDAEPVTVPAMNVKLGDALVIPTGWSFQFSAGPDKALKFLCHTTPPWPEEDEAVAVEHGGLGEATV